MKGYRVRLEDWEAEKALELGKGNLARGVREALKMAGADTQPGEHSGCPSL